MKKIKKHMLPNKCRIIAVSDVHTCWQLLDRLLKKAEYRPGEDYLVIVGDILEHWDQNLETIAYARKLCEIDRVYCLMGNNDTASYHMAYKYDYDKFMLKRSKKPHNTFLQMAEKIGITDFPADRFENLRQEVCQRFRAELDFMQSRPYVLETQNHIFVHAGIENRHDWQNTSDTYALTHPFYLRENQCSGKWVVVGHFPCYNYKRGCCTNLPIVDRDKKIICIDGGMTIKTACQLNAFIIEKSGESYEFSTVWDTLFSKKAVTEDFIKGINDVYIDPYNNCLEMISGGEEISLVRDLIHGGEGCIINSEIQNDNGRLYAWNHLNAFPDVRRGETVHLCRTVGEYANIIAENGKVGWIPKNILTDIN